MWTIYAVLLLLAYSSQFLSLSGGVFGIITAKHYGEIIAEKITSLVMLV